MVCAYMCLTAWHFLSIRTDEDEHQYEYVKQKRNKIENKLLMWHSMIRRAFSSSLMIFIMSFVSFCDGIHLNTHYTYMIFQVFQMILKIEIENNKSFLIYYKRKIIVFIPIPVLLPSCPNDPTQIYDQARQTFCLN